MQKHYDVEIAGFQKKLSLYQVDEESAIPLFISFNEVDLIQAAAKELLEQVAEFDCIVTEEIQGITLAYAMTLLSGKSRFVVARKTAKAYMDDVVAIQTADAHDADNVTYKRLYVSKQDAEYIKDKRVLLVDDVILHGNTMCALSELTNALGGYVVGEASIIRHGFEDACLSSDSQSYLVSLPLFSANGQEVKD